MVRIITLYFSSQKIVLFLSEGSIWYFQEQFLLISSEQVKGFVSAGKYENYHIIYAGFLFLSGVRPKYCFFLWLSLILLQILIPKGFISEVSCEPSLFLGLGIYFLTCLSGLRCRYGIVYGFSLIVTGLMPNSIATVFNPLSQPVAWKILCL